jgi:hypothetical protein
MLSTREVEQGSHDRAAPIGRRLTLRVLSTNILDLCNYGRQEDWEDSPPGWPQHPTYG